MSARLAGVLTLVPTWRLLGLLAAGGAIVALTSANSLLWPLAVAYHGGLAWAAIRDARRLPAADRFAASRHLPRPFSLGALQRVLVGVSCPAAAGLHGAVADHAPRAFRADPRSATGTFDGDGILLAEYGTRPARRGPYVMTQLDVRVWRSGGWWLRQFRLQVADEVVVYPDIQAVRRWELAMRRGVRALPGQRRARPPGAATAPAALRDYLPGDDVRRIHWKATARRDRPITVELEAERGQQVVVALDCGRLMTAAAGHLTKLDHSINAALLIAWVAQAQGDRVGLMTFDDEVRAFVAPRRGGRHLHRLNEVLYRAEATYAEPQFGEAFGRLARQVRGRSLAIVLTDVLDPDASADLVAHALHLAARHRVLVVTMTDPALVAALRRPVRGSRDVYRWAAAEELAASRRRAFETLQRGGVECMDVEADRLSPALIERYLELKERGLI